VLYQKNAISKTLFHRPNDYSANFFEPTKKLLNKLSLNVINTLLNIRKINNESLNINKSLVEYCFDEVYKQLACIM